MAPVVTRKWCCVSRSLRGPVPSLQVHIGAVRLADATPVPTTRVPTPPAA
ncbi:hypothetical protein PC128_g8555 [Phytophthora cactorum]|nr:hypothetical protein PC128_g8555 [Phytophthora cactorum]